MDEVGEGRSSRPSFAFSGYLISILASVATFFRASMSARADVALLISGDEADGEDVPPASRREVVMSRIFGAVCQNGYVVRDIRAAMDHWVNVMGVGPWYYIDRVKTDYFRHRGQDSAMEMSVALANSGDLQIELIQQRNDAPSMYKEFLDSGREGLQHMSYWTRDYQALYDRALSLGYEVGHEGQIGGEKGRFAYFDTQAHPGTVVEISDISGSKGSFFEHIRKVAAGWDGSDPIREVGGR
jgi:Glyoxalase/Bleomycin resistance protein/Dioxygenase superfamily